MLRASARLGTPLVPAAPVIQHVRGIVVPSSRVMSGNQEADDYYASNVRRDAKTGDLEKRLYSLKFPTIKKGKFQDNEIIGVAQAAVEIIKDLDNAREGMERYWQPQRYEAESVIGGSDVKDYEGEYEDQRAMDEDEDADDEDDDEDDEDDDRMQAKEDGEEGEINEGEEMNENENENMTEEEENRKREEEDDMFESEGKNEEEDMLTEDAFNVNDVISAYNQGYRIAKDRLKDFRVENGVASRFSEEEDGIDYTEDKSDESYQDALEEEALENMGDNKFINQSYKVTEKNEDSLRAWFNEYKYVQNGGRFSLAEQTAKYDKFAQDYEIRANYESEEYLKKSHEVRSGFEVNEVLKMGRHCKVTKGGRIFSYSALVLVGTGKGTAGFGYGKGSTAADATTRAFVDAERNLVSVPLYRGGLPNGFQFRKRGSFMKVWTHAPRAERNWNESNMIPHPMMNIIVSAFGWNNANMRTWKRRNWHNMMEGLFETIPKMVSHPEDTARKMGLKLKVLGKDERFDRLKPHYL